MFPTFRSRRKRRSKAARGRFSRDTMLFVAEVVLLVGSLALLFAGSVRKWPATYPATLSMAAAGVAIMHVMSVRRSHRPSLAERMLESLPMIDLSQAVRSATSVDGLYDSLLRTVSTTFPAKAVSLFIRDDDTGAYACRLSTSLASLEKPVAPLAKDAFVVRRLRGLDNPMRLEPGDMKAWQDALMDAPPSVLAKRMLERETLERTNSSLLVQLKTKTELVGLLTIGENEDSELSLKDQQILKGVAGQLALIIENAKLLERLVEHQRLQAELELAAEVQRSLLPVSAPTVFDFDLCGFCKPAQQVGGDYYDFIPIGLERTGLAIADVAGKGISAALLMSVVQASLRGQLLGATGSNEIGTMVELLNKLISGSVSTARYVTFFYAQLDRRDGSLIYVNAGHNPPMLYHSEQREFQALDGGGPVLGVFPGALYQHERADMHVGDVFVAYTDGVTEAMNVEGIEFGEDRLREAIAAASKGSAKEILDNVVNDVTTWSKGTRQHDDITVIVLKKS